MATVTSLASSKTLGNGGTVTLPTMTTDARMIVCVAYACAATPSSPGVTIGGGGSGTTFSLLAGSQYRSRRYACVYLSNQEPTANITITCDVTGTTFAELFYEIFELTSYDNTTPNDTFVGAGDTADVLAGTTLSTATVGTIGSGDVVFAWGAFENGDDGLAWQTGVTEITNLTAGNDVRQTISGYSTTDDTPGFQWTSSGSYGGYILAGIFNDGSTAVPASGYDGTGTWQLFPSANAYLDDGTINTSTHTFKARLLSDSYTADPTDTVLADTTGALGTDQTVTLSVTGGLVSIGSAVSWTGALANVKHILLYDDTPTSPADPLLALVTFENTQSVPTSTTFTLPAGDVYFR